MEEILDRIINPLSAKPLTKKEHIYTSLVLQSSQSLILSACPSLQNQRQFCSFEYHQQFIDWCFFNKKRTDWCLALSFYQYLSYKNEQVSVEILKELIHLACSQWTYADKSTNQTVVICHTRLPSMVFGGNKSLFAQEFREVFLLETDQLRPFIQSHMLDDYFVYWILRDDSEYPSTMGEKL